MSVGRGKWFGEVGQENGEHGVGRGACIVPNLGDNLDNAKGSDNVNTPDDSGWDETPSTQDSGWVETPSSESNTSQWQGGSDRGGSGYRGNRDGGFGRDRGFGGRGRGGGEYRRGGFNNSGDNGGDSGSGGYQRRGGRGGGYSNRGDNDENSGSGGYRGGGRGGGYNNRGDNGEDSGSGGFRHGGRGGGYGNRGDNDEDSGRGGLRRGGRGGGYNNRGDNDENSGSGGYRGGGRGGGYNNRGGNDEDSGSGGFHRGGRGGGYGNRGDNEDSGSGNFRRGGRGGGYNNHGDNGEESGSRGYRGGGSFSNRDNNEGESYDGGYDNQERRGRGGRGRGGGGRGRFQSDGDDDNPSGGGFKERGESGEGEDDVKKVPRYVPEEIPDDESLFASIPSGINFNKYQDISCKISGKDAVQPITSFEDSGLRKLLLNNVRKAGYTVPTPVQKYSIPAIMADRDLMACAQTGSGKTAAFLLPILHNLIPGLESASFKEVQQPYTLIISPTRELAIQIMLEARKFAYDSVVKITILYGGVNVSYQLGQLEKGCHILVATPGRLLDFLKRGKIDFAKLKYLVLDEADRMLDMGFKPLIEEMVNHSSMPPKAERRTLMFSATFPEDIQRMARDYLDNYLFLAVGMVGGANADVKQQFFQVSQYNKREKLLELLKENGKRKTIVFIEQKRNADFVTSIVLQNDVKATSIHGDRYQQQREEALNGFKRGDYDVLVATSVAARGLDIKDVEHVVNFDMPKDIDEYVHRIGRTGRVGNLGLATTFIDTDTNRDVTVPLIKILADAHQEVPDWLQECAQSAGGSGGGYNRGRYGGQDIRSNKEIRGNSEQADPNWDVDDQPKSNSELAETENWD